MSGRQLLYTNHVIIIIINEKIFIKIITVCTNDVNKWVSTALYTKIVPIKSLTGMKLRTMHTVKLSVVCRTLTFIATIIPRWFTLNVIYRVYKVQRLRAKMLLRESNHLHDDSGFLVRTWKSTSGRWVKKLFYVLRIRVIKINLRHPFDLVLISVQNWTASSRMSAFFPVQSS